MKATQAIENTEVVFIKRRTQFIFGGNKVGRDN
jgi:hypothetical protein